MYVANISFSRAEGVPRDQISHTINAFLAALRMNGQVCGREWPISISDSQYQVTVLLPAQDALEHTHMNHYVEHALEHIHILGLNEPSIFVCGEDIDSITCTCSKIDTYILYTTYLSLESPAPLWQYVLELYRYIVCHQPMMVNITILLCGNPIIRLVIVYR